jgi:hypothetical protein
LKNWVNTHYPGTSIGIMGNHEQGYGRPVLTQVLPLSNWPTSKGVGAPDTVEYPSAGLIIYDELGTGEPAINNTTRTRIDHTFTVDSDSTRIVTVGGRQARVVDRGALRIAVAWSDPPSAATTAGTIINDLDLEVESPGPDNDLATTADNVLSTATSTRPAGRGSASGAWDGRRPGARTCRTCATRSRRCTCRRTRTGTGT